MDFNGIYSPINSLALYIARLEYPKVLYLYLFESPINPLYVPTLPTHLRRKPSRKARRQLREAIDCEDPKRLKGALVAAKRMESQWT